jgi:CRISPR/Cas system-associated exonuclease Cas4 (RecB family)
MHKHIVHWAVAIITEQDGKQIVHYGHTHDISPAEVVIFTGEALILKEPVTLEIRIPRGKSITEWVVVEAKCSNGMSISEEDHFRIQLQFQSFTGDGRQVLESALQERGASLEDN